MSGFAQRLLFELSTLAMDLPRSASVGSAKDSVGKMTFPWLNFDFLVDAPLR